ncbi:MAG: S1C family serine protease [Clostridiales bacterium]|jgi:serine protease DegS|nr:S1C family serine protease [Clostridiales bacterium]
MPTTAILLAAVLVLLYVFVWRVPTPQEVFSIAQHYAVELKAERGGDAVSYGSAVLINDDGYLISNAHVVSYTQNTVLQYYIRFSFETDYRAVDLVVYDSDIDIAILKLKEKPSFKLKPVRIADATKIKVGDEVFAVGNGMNHGIGQTHGYISLPRVNIEYDGMMRSVIQCDLIINEGNSGGALLNNKGKLLGLTTFRVKDNKGTPIYGIAFCIPTEIITGYLVCQDIKYVK